MKRATLIKIHLYLSAVFAPFIFLMSITGTSYLLGYKGDVTKEVIQTVVTEQSSLTEEYVREELKKIDPNYSFEYLKGAGKSVFTRPTTRTYYELNIVETGVQITKVKPNFLRAIIEVHKGHGPGLLKTVEKVFGVALLLILISGMWLALTVKRDKSITLILTTIGGTVLFGLFLIL